MSQNIDRELPEIGVPESMSPYSPPSSQFCQEGKRWNDKSQLDQNRRVTTRSRLTSLHLEHFPHFLSLIRSEVEVIEAGDLPSLRAGRDPVLRSENVAESSILLPRRDESFCFSALEGEVVVTESIFGRREEIGC